MAKKNTRRQTSGRRVSNDSDTAASNTDAAASGQYAPEESARADSMMAESGEARTEEATASSEDAKKKSEKKGFLDEYKDKNKLMTSALYGIGVLLSALLAFYIRIIPRDGVFLSNGFIRFGENDPWYHWRNIDFLMHNWPSFLWFDPATTYPFGTLQEFAPLYDYILVAVIKALQLITGNTTEAYAMTIAAYWPCVLAAVCVVAAYFVAKTIFKSRNIGLLTAFLLAVAPGQFLSRSTIGFNDHHVAEVLFSTVVIIFLALALLKLRDKKITYEELFKGKFSAIKPFLPYAILTGIALGAYTLVWEGALLFAFIIGVYITIQMVINHLRGEGTASIALIGIVIFLADLLVILPVPQIGIYRTLHIVALSAGILAILFMAALSYVLEKKKLNRLYYPGILAGLALFVAVVGSLISSTVRTAILSVVGFFTRTGGALTIGEASPYFGDAVNPLFFIVLLAVFVVILILAATSYIRDSRIKKLLLAGWAVAFLMLILFSGRAGNLYWTFSVMGYLWLIALPIIAYTAAKNNSMEKVLLVVWTVMLLWAMVQQNRFSYYFVLPVLIMTSWLFMELMRAVQADEAWKTLKKNFSKEGRAKKIEPAPVYSSKQESAKVRRESSKVKVKADNGNEKIVIAAVVLVVALGVLLVPTFNLTSQYVSGTGGPNEAWIESSLWLRDNTPEIGLDWYGRYEMPPQDPDGNGTSGNRNLFGVEFFVNQVSTVPFDYPGTAYGVLSWWDYGHWLQVIGERMVNANPFQAGVGGRRGSITDDMIPGAAPFFVAETEAAATSVLYDIDPREGLFGARFIVTDIEMASGMSKFYAMTAWTLDTNDYRTIVNIGGQNQSIIGSDRYFNSMVFRLHMLDAAGLEQYRMVYESRAYSPNTHMSWQEILYKTLFNQRYSGNIPETNTGYVKIFEFVEGAVISGTAAPNETVQLALTIQTNQNRVFTYRQTVNADASGAYSFTVPYSTTGPIDGETNFAVRPIGRYLITKSTGEFSVDVTETDVLRGNTVAV
ncbi:MAG: oligosaccharyl transferase, archaeosortase A system-associated [Methanosarcinales archaeon]|nr:oligosaccharyl transferase, archaeosortase A system-associated [Methanosarcinales archaeon]